MGGLRGLAFAELTKAVITRLKASAYTSSYSIYGYVPDSASFPYIVVSTISGVKSISFDSRSAEYEDNLVTIHVYSDYRGDKEAAQMMEDCNQAISSSTLSVTGYRIAMQEMESAVLFVDDTDSTNLIRHGVIEWRFHMATT